MFLEKQRGCRVLHNCILIQLINKLRTLKHTNDLNVLLTVHHSISV
jgi:hypothetical protein